MWGEVYLQSYATAHREVQNCGNLWEQEPSAVDDLSNSLSLFSQSLKVTSRIQKPVRQRGLQNWPLDNRKSEGLPKCSVPSATPFLDHRKERGNGRGWELSAGFHKQHAVQDLSDGSPLRYVVYVMPTAFAIYAAANHTATAKCCFGAILELLAPCLGIHDSCQTRHLLSYAHSPLSWMLKHLEFFLDKLHFLSIAASVWKLPSWIWY